MAALREVFASFGFQVDDKALDRIDKKTSGVANTVKNTEVRMNKFRDSVTKAIGAIGGIYAIKSLAGFSKEMISLADDISKTSERVGVSTDALQEWQYVAGLAGVDTGTLSRAFLDLQKNQGMAVQGSKELRKSFAEVGVSLDDLKNLGPEEIFEKVSVGLGNLDNNAKRVAIANKTMAESGRQLITVFNQGGDAISKQRQEFRDLGGGLNKDFIQSAVRAQDNLLRMQIGFTSLKATIAEAFLPSLERFVEGFRKAQVYIKPLLERTTILRTLLWSLIGVTGALAISMLLPWLPTIAGVIATILVLDHLLVAYERGDKGIRNFVDNVKEGWRTLGAFGLQLADDFNLGMDIITESIDRVVKFWEDSVRVMQELWRPIENVFNKVSKFFGGSGGRPTVNVRGLGSGAQQSAVASSSNSVVNNRNASANTFNQNMSVSVKVDKPGASAQDIADAVRKTTRDVIESENRKAMRAISP
ncbi:MAG: hypothetical protein KDD43_06725 [Bdellovibrionales bacterium]|nr:hypothetical protein [Bdellovibrionales bacterium]